MDTQEDSHGQIGKQRPREIWNLGMKEAMQKRKIDEDNIGIEILGY